jgi:hypothetical protein
MLFCRRYIETHISVDKHTSNLLCKELKHDHELMGSAEA